MSTMTGLVIGLVLASAEIVAAGISNNTHIKEVMEKDAQTCADNAKARINEARIRIRSSMEGA